MLFGVCGDGSRGRTVASWRVGTFVGLLSKDLPLQPTGWMGKFYKMGLIVRTFQYKLTSTMKHLEMLRHAGPGSLGIVFCQMKAARWLGWSMLLAQIPILMML